MKWSDVECGNRRYIGIVQAARRRRSNKGHGQNHRICLIFRFKLFVGTVAVLLANNWTVIINNHRYRRKTRRAEPKCTFFRLKHRLKKTIEAEQIWDDIDEKPIFTNNQFRRQNGVEPQSNFRFSHNHTLRHRCRLLF